MTTRPPASGMPPPAQELRQLTGHTDVVNSAAYSPDGRHIVTASDDQTARIWDAATGAGAAPTQRPRRRGHFSGVQPGRPDHRHRQLTTGPPASGMRPPARSCANSAATPTLSRQRRTARTASASSPPVGTRPPASGMPPRGAGAAPPHRPQRPVYSAAYSPDGKRIVTASGDQTARIWDAATRRGAAPTHAATPTLSTRRRTARTASASSPPVATRPPASGTRPRARSCASSPATPTRVNSAAYSPDGKRIVTASGDQTARIWDAATGEELRQLTGHSGACQLSGVQPGRQEHRHRQ